MRYCSFKQSPILQMRKRLSVFALCMCDAASVNCEPWLNPTVWIVSSSTRVKGWNQSSELITGRLTDVHLIVFCFTSSLSRLVESPVCKDTTSFFFSFFRGNNTTFFFFYPSLAALHTWTSRVIMRQSTRPTEETPTTATGTCHFIFNE